MLNDKSYREETRDIYNKYSIVTSEYDDEYDDTYDDQDIGPSNQDDAIEMDARPFIVPRVNFVCLINNFVMKAYDF